MLTGEIYDMITTEIKRTYVIVRIYEYSKSKLIILIYRDCTWKNIRETLLDQINGPSKPVASF